MSVLLLGIFLTGVLAMLFIAAIFGAGVMKNAFKYYHDVCAATDFAVFSDNRNGSTTGTIELHPQKVERYFTIAYTKITGTTFNGNQFTGGSFPVPVKFEGITPINPGDSLPNKFGGVNGTAIQPGYLVTVNIPVFKGSVWGIQIPPYYVRMQHFANVGSVPIQH